MTRDRDWLRSFLRLGAFAGGATVAERDIERQEDTVLRAMSLLDAQPGVVLADEVGMGKTYEALGVIAARSHEHPNARTLILTPGPDLNTKWIKELRAFGDTSRPMYGGFNGKFVEARTLATLVDGLRKSSIVVAPVSVFAGSRAVSDQAFLLSVWADKRQLAGNQAAAIFRRYREGTTRVAPETARFLGTFDWDDMKRPVREALVAHRNADGSLDALFDAGGYEAFAKTGAVDAALADLRFRILGGLVPDLDLLVVDEAHKLKNADSVRATGVRTVFDKRFDKALFLTATPFQLTVGELSQVFALFGLARSAPADLQDRADRLLADVAAYTDTYNQLDNVWGQLDGAGAADFAAFFERDPELRAEPEDPSLRVVVRLARQLLTLKRDRIEPRFREWMIRSLREDKRTYRQTRRDRLRPSGGPGVPFLLYERFIAELFRSNARTHKAAVQINMVSSFGAAREGALLADEVRTNLEPDAEAYRKMLQRVVSDLRDTRGGHPKVDHVVRDALAAAERGEKTLIFCARVQTLHELRREIDDKWNEQMLEAWRRVYPDAEATDIWDQSTEDARVRGRHSRLQLRFQRGQDALYLALRERYVATLLDALEFAEDNLEDIVRRANEVLSRQRLPKTEAERIDWSIVKRCVEQATALALRDAGGADGVEPEALRRLMDPSFVSLGFDLEEDDVESASVGDRTAEWRIDVEAARLVIPKVHLWSHLTATLFDVPADLRVRTVERLAAYLVSRYVPFLAELLAYARSEGVDVDSIEARALLPVIDRFWTTPAGRPWCKLVRDFLTYAIQLDDARRKEVLDDVVKAGAIVRHTVDGESRERLREAFNTPLYPMILVANEVMQEGLDLHHHCRRVVHHDLAWNPAQLEQRVGRVDRLGSLVQRLRQRAPETKLDISLPLIANTIDERLERTVRHRERWLEFLLGAAPKIEEYGLADAPAQPLPAAFAEALRVELGPGEPRAASRSE
jgi:hypothetical protein